MSPRHIEDGKRLARLYASASNDYFKQVFGRSCPDWKTPTGNARFSVSSCQDWRSDRCARMFENLADGGPMKMPQAWALHLADILLVDGPCQSLRRPCADGRRFRPAHSIVVHLAGK